MANTNSVVRGAAYILIHAPDMTLRNGATQTTERAADPGSDYLKKLPDFLRAYEDAVSYPPNQVYIGGMSPEALRDTAKPWYAHKAEGAGRFGPRGEIMPQDEFYVLMQVCDAFDLVVLEEGFAVEAGARFIKHPLADGSIRARIREGRPLKEVEDAVANEGAEGLYAGGELVGCVRKAHDTDENLSAKIMLENLASKASCTLALLHLARAVGIDRPAVELVLDCSEEASGDINQRGGGNMAKASAEIAGYTGATGADLRAYCAAPAHAVIHAAALVAGGTYEYVAVAAGGSVAKLGMNGRDHVRKGLPVLEDVLGGFAVLIGRNDGVNPEILSENTGRLAVGAGSSPQAVITALVADPLDRIGLGIPDIDKYSAELQNPEITVPAGAGDVPLANYKMIGALAVRRGEIDRDGLEAFAAEHGLSGWAPTQGHIPSGVPYLGFARDDILSGKIDNCMIIGKGSLFLGRMTGLFDGVSFIIRKNKGAPSEEQSDADIGAVRQPSAVLLHDQEAAGIAPRIAVTGHGSETGEEEVLRGAVMAAEKGFSVVYIGSLRDEALTCLPAGGEAEARAVMEGLLSEGGADGAVTMHYPFPLGVASVGRAVAPGTGRAVYIAAATGASAADRVEGMVNNAVYGIIAAKACGVASPAVGILNVDGAGRVEAALKELKSRGYPINFAESGRADGGILMRGNDLLSGACDVMVTDALTGNALVKMLGAFGTGGAGETVGFGYGPGIGRDQDRLIMIVSRASGAAVVAGAVEYAAELVSGGWRKIAADEFAAADAAGLRRTRTAETAGTAQIKKPPPKEAAAAEISGMDVEELEEAVAALWDGGIYAEGGMGCTGPVILVNEAKREAALGILRAGGWIPS